jgi:hypothetical protein
LNGASCPVHHIRMDQWQCHYPFAFMSRDLWMTQNIGSPFFPLVTQYILICPFLW